MGRPGNILKIMSYKGVKFKECPRCKQIKPVSSYTRDKSKTDGLTAWCKKCRNKRKLERRSMGFKEKLSIRDPEKVRANSIIRYAIKNNLIQVPSICSMCWKECIPIAHHPDYSKPRFIH